MEAAIALTLYLSFAAFLILPSFGAPPVFGRLAIGLCASELVATVVWGVGRSECDSGHCALVDTAASAAGLQIPALTGAMFVLAAAYGVHVARRW